MSVVRTFRKLLRGRRMKAQPTFVRAHDELYKLTQGFSSADSPSARIRWATQLFVYIWTPSRDRAFVVRLLRWIRMMEQDRELTQQFAAAWDEMLSGLNSVTLFAEAGLPGHHALPAELMRRLSLRLLPSAREESDAGRLFADIFASPDAVERFIDQPRFIVERFIKVLWPQPGAVSAARIDEDARQALTLLATRIAGRGVTAAIRQRGTAQHIEDSPFYRLIFTTDALVHAAGSSNRQTHFTVWRQSVERCMEELDQVHLHMEDKGVNSALVYDLRSIEARLERMRLLAAVYAMDTASVRSPAGQPAVRELLNTLVRGRLEDVRLRVLLAQSISLLARKTVERTGYGGEHYIAHTRKDYWLMWRAAAGGGLLTVFTAAIKMRLIESHFPLAWEGFFIGTDYAISFVLLQIFGFALATKQPSMTAATLAGIIRNSRGVTRWTNISTFAADISRTQLAAAFSNVIAVCVGAVAFEKLWLHMFSMSYLAPESAHHVMTTLHPFTSGTAIFAAFTGVILWLAAVIGGWFENFAVYHRIPEAIAQHPLGLRVGSRTMLRAAGWIEHNIASWSTSIVLGYLLGFSPVVARFFGIPLDVRHVTLSTGTLALAAARFGTASFGHGWLWYAVAGIGITFVLNLSVSFSIASMVALRAYDVPLNEQWQLVKFLVREVIDSPLTFVFPMQENVLSISSEMKAQKEEEVSIES